MSKKILIISQAEVIGVVGGAIKSFCILANSLAQSGYEVIAACYNSKDGKPYIKLDEKVKFINLYYLNTDNYQPKEHKISLAEKFFNNIFLRQVVKLNAFEYSKKIEHLINQEKPDMMICFFPHILFQCMYMKNYSIPKVLLYRSRPDVYYKTITTPKINIPLIKLASKKADYAQVLFDSHKKTARKYVKCSIDTISNYVEIPELQADLSTCKKTIIYLSRVDKSKGQDFLIKSFAKIAHKYSDWQVHIYGEFQPPEIEHHLNDLIKAYKLQNQIKILGKINNPIEKFSQADFCVFPSYFEGFPNGLSEAMSVGLPCIGLKSCLGVNELIKHNENGFLSAKNENAFAEKIALLIENKELRIKFGAKARESMKEYSFDNYINKWQNFIEKILNKKMKYS